MHDAPLTADEALAILRDVFAAPIRLELVPEQWWGKPEATLRLSFEAVEDAGWANLRCELDTGDGTSTTGQWIETVPRDLAVGRARYVAFAEALWAAIPTLFVRRGPGRDDPSELFVSAVLRDSRLVAREDFVAALTLTR